MKILNPTDFKFKEKVRLNKDGIIIGSIVNYKGKLFYMSPRTDKHFFIKYNGFGVSKSLFWSLLRRDFGKKWQKVVGIKWNVEGIIIFYKGKREKRCYFADLDTWFLKGQAYGTSKYSETIETYGEQYILNKKHMKIIGYDKDDFEVLKRERRLVKWNRH